MLNIRIKLDKEECIIFLKGRRSFHSLLELDRDLAVSALMMYVPLFKGVMSRDCVV